MKEKHEKRTQEKGITLIALVVTIVVLLILAGVSITVLFGDSGIIKMAQEAAQKTQDAADKDNEDLGKLDEYLTSGKWGTGGDTSKIEYDKNNPTKGTKIEGTNADWKETVNGKEQVAKIPVGFSVVKDVGTDINNIQNGLVISDVAEDDLDNTARGNQFVWIPVEDFSKFVRIEGFRNGARHTMLEVCEEAGKEGDTPSTDESKAMYQSVAENGGFYIGRFEAGVDETHILFELDEEGKKPENLPESNGKTHPVSKVGVAPWTLIPWSESDEEATDGYPGIDTENGAVKVARSMYPSTDTTYGVTSTLCYGVEWDAIMQFIDPNYLWKTGEIDNVVTNSFVRSNGVEEIDSTLGLTGSRSKDEQKHIYDLSTNVEEWTMEGFSRWAYGLFEGRVTRGRECPSDRSIDTDGCTLTSKYCGFRVALYI